MELVSLTKGRLSVHLHSSMFNPVNDKMVRILIFFTLLLAPLGASGANWKGEKRTIGDVKYQCKCYSDNACFPTLMDWATLNKTVKGTLKVALPPGAPCYRMIGNLTTNVYDAAVCADVQANWANEQYL
jgi:hypothetical protein